MAIVEATNHILGLMYSSRRDRDGRWYHEGEPLLTFAPTSPLRDGIECPGLSRFIADLQVAAPALLHEIAHPRLRATFGTLYYGFYHLGGLISGLMCSEWFFSCSDTA